jgi:hypothetical protein
MTVTCLAKLRKKRKFILQKLKNVDTLIANTKILTPAQKLLIKMIRKLKIQKRKKVWGG